MKKLSIQNVKKLSKIDMRRIMAGSDSGGGGGGTGGGGTTPNDCGHTCWIPGHSGQCAYVCTFCYVAPGLTYGQCQG
ncbi:hypothetical protein [Puia sp.]|uniref:hypothetical protein n=1 Tax=Puia sp. TaxID=2045100 RepID=UPI002F3ED462